MSLPVGAKRLEYIRGNGNQYIKTRFFPTNNTRILFNVVADMATGWPYGVRKSGSAEMFGVMINDGKSFRHCYGSSTATLTTETTARSTLHQNRNLLTFDGVTTTISEQTFSCTYELYLFNLNNAGGTGTGFGGACYGGLIFEKGLLERDYIPCQLVDGSIGLWDDVYDVFYGNAGTGSFTAGPEVTEAWEGTQLEYVQSDGNQYLDTRVAHSSASNIVLNADLSYDTVSVSSGQIMGFTGNAGNGFGISSGGAWWEASSIPNATAGTRYNIEWGVNGASAYRTVDGKTVSITRGQYSFTSDLFLFAALGTVGATTLSHHCYCKTYDADITVNGTAERSYIPWLHPSGVAGLLDTVNDRFYASASTTDLIAGPVAILIPTSPADLTATLPTATQVQLSWSASANATGYRVYRDGVLISDRSGTTFTETVAKNQTYTYAVSAYNDEGESEASNVSIFVPLAPPATPTGFEVALDEEKVSITWAADSEALGYRLYRDEVLLTDQTTTGYSETVDPFLHYTYSLLAYNKDGDSAAAAQTVFVSVKNPLPWLITDRTEADVDYLKNLRAIPANKWPGPSVVGEAVVGECIVGLSTLEWFLRGNAKGGYNSADFNRVGAAMAYVAGKLGGAGFDPNISPKTDWKITDKPSLSTMRQYLSNLTVLRSKLPVIRPTPDVPSDMRGLTIEEANDIEQILLNVHDTLLALMAAWIYSGEIYGGEI